MKGRGAFRRNLVAGARAIPAGRWTPEDQFTVRGILADLVHEFVVLVEESKALRAARAVKP